MKIFYMAKERAIISYMTIILVFGVVFFVLGDNKITVEEMGIVTAVIGLAGFVYGYYFGTSKGESDRQKSDTDSKKTTVSIEKTETEK